MWRGEVRVEICLPTINPLNQMADREAFPVIGLKLSAPRQEKGLTLQLVADRCNFSKGLLSKNENSRTLSSLPVFIAIVQALELSLRQFFEDMNSKKEILLAHIGLGVHIFRERGSPFPTGSSSPSRFRPAASGLWPSRWMQTQPGNLHPPTV